MSYEVKIDAFEGPIDLLLHLLKKDKVEIYDIKISEITRQYLDYIATMKKLDLDVASQFLVMAARLMEIKAQTLLPSKKKDDEEEEVDPRQQLVERLLEYKKFKELASKLQTFEKKQRKSYTRNVAPLLSQLDFEEQNPLEDVSLDDFIGAFKDVLRKKAKRKQEDKKEEKKVDNKLVHLRKENFKIEEQKALIIDKLLTFKGQINFEEIFLELDSRLEIVVTFMALLELIKLQEIKVKQENNFASIKVYWLGSVENVKSS